MNPTDNSKSIYAKAKQYVDRCTIIEGPPGMFAIHAPDIEHQMIAALYYVLRNSFTENERLKAENTRLRAELMNRPSNN